MAKFIFRLQTVLRHRLMIEDQRQRQLARFLRERMILLDQLRLLQQTIGQSKRDLGESLTGQVDMGQVAQFARFSGQATQRAQQLVVRLSVVEKQIEEARQNLLAATKDRKAMELLRDRHRELWQQEEEHKENAIIDEMGLQTFMRQQAAEVTP